MGAPTLVGLAGSAADTGFAPVMFEWHVRIQFIILVLPNSPGWLSGKGVRSPQFPSHSHPYSDVHCQST